MKTREIIELLILAAIWGASFLLMRIAAPEFGPVALIAVRVLVAMMFLLFVLKWQNRLADLKGKSLPLTVLGLINSVIPFILFAYATLHVTAGFAAVLNASVPLFGAVVAYFWLRENLTWLRVIGLFVGFVGVVILVWERISFKDGGSGWAVLAALFASLSYGVAANYTKKKLGGVNPLAIATGSQIAGAIILTPVAYFYWPQTNPSMTSWVSAIVLGVFCTAVAYMLFFRLIANVGPTKAISVTYLLPISGALWGFVFLDEVITGNMLLGGLVILIGTALTTGIIRMTTTVKPALSS